MKNNCKDNIICCYCSIRSFLKNLELILMVLLSFLFAINSYSDIKSFIFFGVLSVIFLIGGILFYIKRINTFVINLNNDTFEFSYAVNTKYKFKFKDIESVYRVGDGIKIETSDNCFIVYKTNWNYGKVIKYFKNKKLLRW